MKTRTMTMWVAVCSAIFFLCASATLVSAKQKPIIMRIASDHPVTAPHAAVFKDMEKTITELTNGRIKFEAYFGGALYSAADALMAVQTGSLEMCIGSSTLASISPGWSVICDLPFLFDNSDHYERFLRSDALKKVDKELEKRGIVHMSDWMSYGFGPCHIFNNKRNVEKLEDLKGIKMRVPPYPTLVKVVKALGMGNVTISPPEVVTALEQGMVDGLFAHAFALKSYNLKPRCRYMAECSIVQAPLGLAFSKKFWDKLPPDLQKILWDFFKEEGKKLNEELKTAAKSIFDDYAAAPGNVVTVIKDAEKDRWRKVIRPVYEDAMKNQEIRMVVEAANATR